MRNPRSLAVAVTTLVLAWALPAVAQSRVTGKLVDVEGNPVRGAKIRFVLQESDFADVLKTRKNGLFTHNGLRPGGAGEGLEPDQERRGYKWHGGQLHGSLHQECLSS